MSALIDNDRHDHVVALLYRAAAGQERFDVALGAMMEHLRDRTLGAQMIGLDPATGGLTFSHAALDTPGESDLEYMRKYHQVDPRIPMLVQREPGDWLWCEDVFPPERTSNEPYYRDLLIPIGGQHSGTAKVYQSEREIVLLGVFSRTGQRFAPEVREYVARMGRYITEALAINRHVRALATGHAVGLELIERLGKPAWVVDDMRELVGANKRAAEVMAAGVPFRELGGRLTAFSPLADNQVAAAISGLMRTAQQDNPNPRTILKLANGTTSYLVSVSLFQPQATLHFFGDRPRCLVMLHTAAQLPEPDTYLWQVAFDLTPAEARVASEIYQGRTVRAAAEAVGVSFNTANTQLDSVYAKTGVHGKVELVRLLQSLQ